MPHYSVCDIVIKFMKNGYILKKCFNKIIFKVFKKLDYCDLVSRVNILNNILLFLKKVGF